MQWVFQALTQEEYAYFYTTLLAGALSVTLTAAELKDNFKVDRTFTEGQLYRPIYTVYKAGLYWGVTVEIRHLLPLL